MRTGLVIALVLAATTSGAIATPAMTVSSSGTPGALVLDGQGSSATHVVKIADVALSTDGAHGLTVSIASGDLIKADGRTPIPFRVLVVAHGASAPAPAAFTTPSGTSYTWSTTGPGAVDNDLYLEYTPASLQDPGSYAASVDLGVADN